jgi:thymidylate kinase
MGMTACPVPTRPIPERVVVVGCAGSGKTTLARECAARLDARHIERDALGDDEAPGFAALVAAAVEAAGRRWVFDGAPYNAEALVYQRALPDRAVDIWVPRQRLCSGRVK